MSQIIHGWLSIIFSINKTVDQGLCINLAIIHHLNPSKSPLSGQVKSSCTLYCSPIFPRFLYFPMIFPHFPMIFPYLPMILIFSKRFSFQKPPPWANNGAPLAKAALGCRAAPISPGGAMVGAICRTVPSSATSWAAIFWGGRGVTMIVHYHEL